MEKSELYYIVLNGTNDRAQTVDDIPLIVRQGYTDDMIDKCKELAELEGLDTYTFEEISIEEYERTFTEQDVWL